MNMQRAPAPKAKKKNRAPVVPNYRLNTERCPVLLVVQAAGLLPLPRQVAYIRCAGSVGADTFKELDELDMVPISGRRSAIDDNDDVLDRFPLQSNFFTSDYTAAFKLEERIPPPSVHERRRVEWTTSNARSEWISFKLGALTISQPAFIRLGIPFRCDAPISEAWLIDRMRVVWTSGDLRSLHGFFVFPNAHAERWMPVVMAIHLHIPPTCDAGLVVPRELDQHFLSIVESLVLPCWVAGTIFQPLYFGSPSSCTNLSALRFTPSSVCTITNNFLTNCFIPTGMIDLTPFRGVTTIQDKFMSGCDVKKLDLRSWTALTTIGSYFVSFCGCAVSVRLPRCIMSVGTDFLSNCASIQTFDMSPLSNLKVLPSKFMAKCGNLLAVDFTPLVNVEQVEDDAFENCSLLSHVDLSAFKKNAQISSKAFVRCDGIVSVVFPRGMEHIPQGISQMVSSLKYMNVASTKLTSVNIPHTPALESLQLPSSITSLPQAFLLHSTALRHLNISNLVSLTVIPSDFLKGCTLLESLQLPRSIRTLPDNFLSGFSNLKTLDLSRMSNLSTIPDGLLSGCSSLISLHLPVGVRSLPRYALCGCIALTELRLRGLTDMTSLPVFTTTLPNVTCVELPSSICILPPSFLLGSVMLVEMDLSLLVDMAGLPTKFMVDCTSLTTLKLPPSITTLPAEFMSGCTSLEGVDLHEMASIKVLPEGFLRGCTALKTVNLPPNVTAVHNDFCYGCSGIKTVDLSPLKHIKVLNRGFLAGCTSLLAVDMTPLSGLLDAYGGLYGVGEDVAAHGIISDDNDNIGQ